MKNDGDRSPDQIQADIERTRSSLDETLSAIEHRLTPGQLVDQGIDYLRHSGAREYVVNLGASAKQDPLPLALVGIGLGWLMLSNRRELARHGVVTRSGPSAETLAEGARDAASSVRDTVSSAVSTVGETVSSVRDSAARTTQKISETTRAARDRAHQVGAAVRDGADRVRSGVDRLVHEQPLALGAIGIAVGAVLAASAPRTRQEDKLMGEASDRLRDDVTERVEHQLDRATSALKEGGADAVNGSDAEERAGRPVPAVLMASPPGTR
jgi:hypothetical protein